MKLIIINGPCGIGKSTAAINVHQSMPLSFLVDKDAQSRFISHYREYTEERRHLRETVCNAIIRACLQNKTTVIVEQMLFDEEILNSYQSMAEEFDVEIHEILLWAPKEIVMKRAHERGWREGGLLTPEKCELFWEKIDALKDRRVQATVVDVTDMNEDQVLKAIEGII